MNPSVEKILNFLNYLLPALVILFAVVTEYGWLDRKIDFPMRLEALTNGRLGFVKIDYKGGKGGEDPRKKPEAVMVLDPKWTRLDDFARRAILARETVRYMAVLKIHDEAGGGEKGWSASGEFLAHHADNHPTFLELFNTAHHELDVYSPEELINWEDNHPLSIGDEAQPASHASHEDGGSKAVRETDLRVHFG